MPRPKKEKQHLIDFYEDLVVQLDKLGYNTEEIGTIMNRSRSVILRIIQKVAKEKDQQGQ